MLNKRLLSLILAIMMMLSCLLAFASCGKDEEGTITEETDCPKADDDENPNIPAKDYGGYEFKFLTKEGSSYNTRYIVASDETGEVLSHYVTERNKAVEEKYNVKIKQVKVDDIVAKVRSSVLSGVIEYDAILAAGRELATMNIEGLLLDLNTVERFDFTKSYWDKNACEQLEINGKLYFTNCAMNIHSYGYGMFFNEKLLSDNGLKTPHEYMAENNWTIDTWTMLAKSVSKDLNDDKKMTAADRYGMLSDHTYASLMSYASGIRLTAKNDEGKPEITLLDDQTKLSTVFSKVNELFMDKNVCICNRCDHKEAHGYSSTFAYTRYLFTQDYYLFHIDDVTAVKHFMDMDSEYGIAPLPKYDAAQESYYSMYEPYYNLFALPVLIEDAERTYSIIEDMNYYSSKMVTPALVDTLLQRKSSRDDDSEESLKILRDNTVYDVGLCYEIGNVRSAVFNLNLCEKVDVVRQYQKSQRTIKMALDAIVERIEKR